MNNSPKEENINLMVYFQQSIRLFSQIMSVFLQTLTKKYILLVYSNLEKCIINLSFRIMRYLE